MHSKTKLQITIFLLSLGSTPFLHARISSLSPWSLQDRQPTEQWKFDQSASFQFGTGGVSPTGEDMGVNLINIPYNVAYGVTKEMEVGAGWGLEWLNRKYSNSQFGVTDLSIASRYRFFDPDRKMRIPGLDLEFGFTFPTGSFNKGLGTGSLGLLFNWGLVLPLDPVRVHFGMGFKYNAENSDSVQVGSVFSYDGGITYPIKLKQKSYQDALSLTGEIKGFNHAHSKFSGTAFGPASDELYLVPGAIWKLNDRYQFLGSFLLGLTSDSSNIGANIELRF